MKLRPYQSKGIDLTRKAFSDGFNKILFFLATGGGKSVIFITLVNNLLSKNNRVILVMRRKQLVLQAQRHFAKHGISSSVIMGNEKGLDKTNKLQICSIDTVMRRDISFMQEFEAVIVDEAHDTTSNNYREFLDSIKAKIFIGLTATPFKVGKKVQDFWQCCVKPIEAHELRDQGYLTDARIYIPSNIDLSDVKTDSKTGDYQQKQLAEKMGQLEIIGDVVAGYKKFGEDKPAICFAVNKDHSIKLCAEFNNSGIPAVHCDESTKQKERDQSIEKLVSGEIKVLCNVNIFSTGVDIPQAEVLIMARPTKSEILYIQQVGRGLRPYRRCGKCHSAYDNSENCPVCGYDKPEYVKRHCTIIDNGNNISRFGPPFKVRNAILSEEDEKKKQEKEKDEFQIKTCKFCFAAYSANLKSCPECEKENDKVQREIKRADGTIVPYDEFEFIQRRLLELEKVKIMRGLKSNFPFFKLYEEFGDLVYQYPVLNVPKWIPKIIEKNSKDKVYR